MTEIFFIIGLFFAAIANVKDRKNYRPFIFSIIGGLIVSFSLFLIKFIYPAQSNILLTRINRYVIILTSVILTISLIVTIIILINSFSKTKKENSLIDRIFISINSFLLFVIISFQFQAVFAKVTKFVYFGETGLSTSALLRAIGYILSLILMILLAFSIFHAAKQLKKTALYSFVLTGLLVVYFDYFTRTVKALQRLKYISAKNKLVFDIIIFGDKFSSRFILFCAFIVITLSLYLFSGSLKVRGSFANNALRRIEKARLLRNRRWSYLLFSSSVIIMLILTVGYDFAHKEVELTPPSPFEQTETQIIIPLSDVNDGNLYRFSFITPGNIDVRFIVVKKPNSNAYGLGLDACEICGVAGYYQKGNEVVCKRCDVVMNIATIGYKGGCNPVPFEYSIRDGNIIIDKEVLLREESRFK